MGISKRCECRGTDGKRLGAACPQLSKRSHGKHRVSQELPEDAEGHRRRFQRTGYIDAKDATRDLDRIRAILDLPGDDEDGLRRVGDLLAELQTTRGPIPEPTEVSRKLGVGVPLDGKTTVGDWLDHVMTNKATRTTTNRGYGSHIRVHLKPAIGHLRLDRLGVGHVEDMFAAIDDRNDVIRAENLARHEQVARCTRGKPGAPKAAERAQLAAERATLAEMPPFRRITGPATKQAIRRTLRMALNKAIAGQLITFNAAQHVELAAAARPKGLLWTDERVERWRETGVKPGPVMVWTASPARGVPRRGRGRPPVRVLPPDRTPRAAARRGSRAGVGRLQCGPEGDPRLCRDRGRRVDADRDGAEDRRLRGHREGRRGDGAGPAGAPRAAARRAGRVERAGRG